MSERPSEMEIQQAKTDAAHEQFITDKAKVLAKWPDAFCGAADFGYRVMRAGSVWMSFTRDTEPEAWADTARRLEEKK